MNAPFEVALLDRRGEGGGLVAETQYLSCLVTTTAVCCSCRRRGLTLVSGPSCVMRTRDGSTYHSVACMGFIALPALPSFLVLLACHLPISWSTRRVCFRSPVFPCYPFLIVFFRFSSIVLCFHALLSLFRPFSLFRVFRII